MNVSPDQWPRVKAVLTAALELEGAARAAYVAEACRDDSDVRHHVETLLASPDHGATFLETSAFGPRPAFGMEALTGHVAGTYRIEAAIGVGGMGEVYRARDLKLDRPVALKLLSAPVARDPDRLRRFRAEARAASSLNHPHILVIHDFGELEGRPFIVTEFVEGQTLRQQLEGGPLPVRDAVEIAMEVAPVDNTSREDVDDVRDVYEPPPGHHVGQVRDPPLLRPRRGEIPID